MEKELRIGNIIQSDLGKPSKVITLGHNTIEVVPIGKDNVNWVTVFRPEPIELTQEWLNEFGFKYDGDLHPNYTKENYIIEATLLRNGWNLRQIMNKEDSLCIKSNFKFVHELQNLWFALKGKELTA